MTQKTTFTFGLFLGLTLLFAKPGFAAKFANQFAEFELPPQWQCNLEGAEWVCQNTNEAKKRDAIIVLAAKMKGDQDSLDQYLTYLKAAKVFNSVIGKPVKSEPRFAKTVNLNGQAWVDALHMESEIPGFYTRYLATVKQDIGVLVTYSVSKAKYTSYQGDFDNMIKTLKVFRKAGGINVAPASTNLFQNAQIPAGVGSDTVFPGAQVQGGADQKPAAPKESLPWPMILGILGVVGFIVWKRRQNNLQ